MSQKLRALLDNAVDDLDRYPLEAQPARLREIALIEPHAVSPLESTEPLGSYNCVMHALNLIGKMTDYPHPLLVAKTLLVRYLIEDEILKACEPRAGALVTWSMPDGLKHIGKLIAPDRAESKWGLGLLCQHALAEVPVRYGDPSRFYSPIEPQSALNYLRRLISPEDAR